MSSLLVGWILIIIGISFLLLGFAAATKSILQERSNKDSAESSNFDVSLFKLSIELISALTKAPQWLALTVVGIILVILGSSWAF